MRMVAVQTDAKLRPAPQIPHFEPTWQIHHTCRIIKTAGCLSYSKAQLAHIGSLATAFPITNPGFTFTPLYWRMWLTLCVSSPVYGPVQNVFSLHSAFNIPGFHLNETEISGK